MNDETYLIEEPGSNSRILVTTNTPGSMRSLAWTRQVGTAKVACIQGGHGHIAWTNPNWRRLLAQSLRWCAG